jgi:RimJ/RimL family protein N-acetyltransferase
MLPNSKRFKPRLYTLSHMIRLRPMEDRDLDILFDFQADLESARMATVPPRDRESYESHMAKVRGDADVIIRIIEEGTIVVGYLLSWSVDETRMLGYWIGREHWGQGYASLSLQLFVTELAVRPLTAHVASTNLGSQKVLEKNGFFLVSSEELKDSIFGPIKLMNYVL